MTPFQPFKGAESVQEKQNSLHNHLTFVSNRDTLISLSSSTEKNQDKIQFKDMKTSHKFFVVFSKMLDVIGSISAVVVGGGAAAGLVLNLCGYGYVLPSNVMNDGFKIKIEAIEQLRTDNEFARMAASDAYNSAKPRSVIDATKD